MTDEEVLAAAEEWGVDLSLLRDNLSLTVIERLRRHEQALELVEAMREVGEQWYGPLPSRNTGPGE